MIPPSSPEPPSTRPVNSRALIAGAGLMGRWHAHELEKVGRTIAGTIDIDIERARSLAGHREGIPSFSDLASALEATEADVLHVCTPVETHETLIAQGIEAGLHVLVEKPLAADEATTRRLLTLANEKDVKLCPVFQFLFQPGVLKALELIRSIAPLRHIETRAYSAGAEGRDAAERDAVALEILPHPVSLLHRFIAGDTASLDWNVLNPEPGELRATAAAEGMSLSILVSMGGRPTSNEMWIHGERGTLYLDLFHGFCVRYEGNVSRGQKVTRPFWISLKTAVTAGENLARRILRDEPAYPGLRDLIGRFYRSTDEGSPSPIDEHEILDNSATIDRIAALLAESRAQQQTKDRTQAPERRPATF